MASISPATSDQEKAIYSDGETALGSHTSVYEFNGTGESNEAEFGETKELR